jgi:hypothetical protein
MEQKVTYHDGEREYIGYYSVDRKGILTVSSSYGSKSTQVGGSTAASLARLLLRELVGAARI